MQTRNVGRLDYAKLHNTGERVLKEKIIMEDPIMVEELKCRGDIDYTLLMYKIEELENEEDANDGLSEMDKLSRQFRHLHVELKKKLAEKYVEHYPDYEKICDKIVTFTKDIRRKLTNLKNHKNVNVATVDVETLISKISISYLQ